MDNRIKVQCLKCGKKWKTASSLPQCSRCNSVDIEPVYEPLLVARDHRKIDICADAEWQGGE